MLCLQVAASGQYNAFTQSASESVAVGVSGVIAKSSDGQNWTTVNSGVTADLVSIAWSGNIYTAVGAGGTIISSDNGSLWTSRSGSSTEDFVQVLWGGQFFVAFRTSGQALTSVDGVNWLERPASDPILSPVVEPLGLLNQLPYTALTHRTPDKQLWAAITFGGIAVHKKIEWDGASLVTSDTQRGWAALTARIEYADWLSSNAVPPAASAPDDDHDEDGVSNLVSYAYAWDKTAPVGDFTPKLTRAAGTGVLSASLMRPETERSDVSYILEFSPTLTSTSWVQIASKLPYGIWTGLGDATEMSGDPDFVQVAVDSDTYNNYTTGFVRMRLELIPTN